VRAAHATTEPVTSAPPESAAIPGGQAAVSDPAFDEQWGRLRSSDDIQFAPLELPEAQPPPQWLQDFLAWLGQALDPVFRAMGQAARAIGVSGQVLTGIVVLIGAVIALFLLWRTVGPLRFRPRTDSAAATNAWLPEAGAAQILLEQADRLASEGRFDEAVHLLLERSVEQIAASRPEWIEPSTTAREIAALPALPAQARGAFAVIAGRAERSLFALQALNANDWQAARTAYAAFALAAPGSLAEQPTA
jgi:hypothetical protein